MLLYIIWIVNGVAKNNISTLLRSTFLASPAFGTCTKTRMIARSAFRKVFLSKMSKISETFSTVSPHFPTYDKRWETQPILQHSKTYTKE